MKALAVLAALVTACLSAGDSPPTEPNAEGLAAFSHAGLNPVPLTGEAVLTIPALGMPRDLLAEGAWLWVSDRSGEPFLHLVHLGRRAVVTSFGQAGEGPGDFGGFPQLSLRPGDSGGVWGYDERQFRMTRITHDSTPAVTTLRLEYPSLAFWGGWVGTNVLAQIGDFDTNRVMLVDTAGTLKRIHTIPLLGPDSVSIEARRNAATGIYVCAQPETARFAVAYLTAGRVELVDTTGGHVLASVPFASNGAFSRDADGSWNLRTPWRYYADCSATASSVYALFAGHTDDGVTVAARHVHHFDWNGTLLGVMALDRAASVISVSGDSVIYAASAETDTIFRYRLPKPVSTSVCKP